MFIDRFLDAYQASKDYRSYLYLQRAGLSLLSQFNWGKQLKRILYVRKQSIAIEKKPESAHVPQGYVKLIPIVLTNISVKHFSGRCYNHTDTQLLYSTYQCARLFSKVSVFLEVLAASMQITRHCDPNRSVKLMGVSG